MPHIVLEIANIEENIARPSTVQVIRQLNEKLGINKDIAVRFTGSGGSAQTKNSSIASTNKNNRLPGDEYITISDSEEYDDDRPRQVAIFQSESKVIFKDTPLAITISPVYQRIVTTINARCVASDKTTADNWVSNLKRRTSQGAIENTHAIDYSYPLPLEYMYILLELYRLRELNSGYGEDIGTWLRNCLTDADTVITDLAGNNPTVVIREKQIAILGWFDFTDAPPKVEREAEAGAWAIDFTYTYSYDRVESVTFKYPLMIHNTLLDSRFYDTVVQNDLQNYFRRYTVSNLNNQLLEANENGLEAVLTKPGIPIPTFDDWLPKYEYPNQINIFRIMLQADPANPNALLSLSQLGDWAISEYVLDYLRTNPTGLLRPKESLLSVCLYKNDTLIDSSNIMVSPTLDLHTVQPLDPRARYHLTINCVNDVRHLSAAALAALCKHGQLCLDFIRFSMPYIDELVYLPNIMAGNRISYPLLRQALDSIAYPISTAAFARHALANTTASRNISANNTNPGVKRYGPDGQEIYYDDSSYTSYNSASNRSDYAWRLIASCLISIKEQ